MAVNDELTKISQNTYTLHLTPIGLLCRQGRDMDNAAKTVLMLWLLTIAGFLGLYQLLLSTDGLAISLAKVWFRWLKLAVVQFITILCPSALIWKAATAVFNIFNHSLVSIRERLECFIGFLTVAFYHPLIDDVALLYPIFIGSSHLYPDFSVYLSVFKCSFLAFVFVLPPLSSPVALIQDLVGDARLNFLPLSPKNISCCQLHFFRVSMLLSRILWAANFPPISAWKTLLLQGP